MARKQPRRPAAQHGHVELPIKVAMNHRLLRRAALMLSLAGVAAAWPALAATPEEILAAYARQAGTAPSPERGQRFFTERRKDGLYPSCAACHGDPTGTGKDLLSDKPLPALAPAFNSRRFTDAAHVEYRFRMNCLDMVGRECTPAEKADVMSWLLSLKR